MKEGAQSSPLFAYQRRERRSWLLFIRALIVQIMQQVTPFFVAEKTTLADDLRYLRWHDFIPVLVPAGDALEHVTRKDR